MKNFPVLEVNGKDYYLIESKKQLHSVEKPTEIISLTNFALQCLSFIAEKGVRKNV